MSGFELGFRRPWARERHPRIPAGRGRVAARPRLPQTGAALPSSPPGPGLRLSPLQSGWPPGSPSRRAAASALGARRLTGAGRARRPPTGQGRPRALPGPLSPQSPGRAPGLGASPADPAPSRLTASHFLSPADPHLVFPCPGKEIARWVFPSLPA